MKTYREFKTEEVETIKKYYKTLPIEDIAKMINRSVRVVNHKMKALGLTGKPNDMALKRKKKWKEIETEYSTNIKELLYSWYWVENKSLLEISYILNVSNRTVNSWLIVLEIPRRSNSEGTNIRYSKMTKQQIDAKLLNAREAHKRICSLVNTEDRRYDRDDEWLKISEIVKTRDKFKCTDCGMSEEESYRIYNNGLCIHHVIPYHICRCHEVDNLISLCTGCHLKLHRKYWWEEVRKQKRLLELKESGQTQFTISQF
jgi:transposase